jgi:hypothetical protein
MNPAVRQVLGEHRRPGTAGRKIVTVVFPNPDTGKAWTAIRKTFSRALKDAGVARHFTFHGLRHTTASHLTVSGVDLRGRGEDPRTQRPEDDLAVRPPCPGLSTRRSGTAGLLGRHGGRTPGRGLKAVSKKCPSN